MDVTEDIVAVGNVVDNHAESIQIVQLVDCLVLRAHLAVDGIRVLDPAVNRPVDADGGKPVGDFRLDGVHEVLRACLVFVQIVDDLLVALGVEVLQRHVFELPLDLLHAEPVRQRRVNFHRLHRLGNLFGRRLVLQGPRVMQPVRDFDQDDPDVFGHCHEHLAQVFHLLLFGRGILHAREFRDAFDQLGDRLPEHVGDFVEACVGVFQTVVQQRGDNCVGVQTDLRHNFCHCQRVNDIRLSRLSQLVFVLAVGVFIRLLNLLKICRRRIALHRLHHRSVMFFSGFHSGSCL